MQFTPPYTVPVTQRRQLPPQFFGPGLWIMSHRLWALSFAGRSPVPRSLGALRRWSIGESRWWDTALLNIRCTCSWTTGSRHREPVKKTVFYWLYRRCCTRWIHAGLPHACEWDFRWLLRRAVGPTSWMSLQDSLVGRICPSTSWQMRLAVPWVPIILRFRYRGCCELMPCTSSSSCWSRLGRNDLVHRPMVVAVLLKMLQG